LAEVALLARTEAHFAEIERRKARVETEEPDPVGAGRQRSDAEAAVGREHGAGEILPARVADPRQGGAQLLEGESREPAGGEPGAAVVERRDVDEHLAVLRLARARAPARRARTPRPERSPALVRRHLERAVGIERDAQRLHAELGLRTGGHQLARLRP